MRQCICEVLRKDPPIEITDALTIDESGVSIAGVSLQLGETFHVAIKHMHHDPTEWKEPAAFIPDRFDPESHYWRQPGGKAAGEFADKRNPFAYNPFGGGQRTCLGKTLSESILKLSLPVIYHHYNF